MTGVFAWRAYLADESYFDSTMGSPDDVPRSPRVVCISQPGQDKGENWGDVLTNGDWYIWREDLQCWTEHSDAGTLLELVDHAPVIGSVRAGKYVSKQVFHELWARAREDVA